MTQGLVKHETHITFGDVCVWDYGCCCYTWCPIAQAETFI